MTTTEHAEHEVVIVGAGSTGLVLGAELALAGIDVAIVERRPSQDLDGVRARGLHSRTLEVLDQRGIVDRFLAAGQAMQIQGYAAIPVSIEDLPTRHPYGLALWQRHIERLLADWALGDLGVTIRRGVEVAALAQDDDGVEVALADGTTLRAAYVVGCDGGRSVVRQAAGIDFVGIDASTSWMIAEVLAQEDPPIGMRPEGGGIGPLDPIGDPGRYQVVLKEAEVHVGDEPTLDDLRTALVAAYGTDFGVHDPTWISRFTDASRQAASYRSGRVLVAGDAAHVHPPQGGQGLNTGVQDAVNLGWKLAQVVRGTSPASLLDTYEAERHPVAARVLQNTQAQVAISTPGERHQSLRDALAELLAMDEPRRHVAAMLSGLDIAYDLGEGHPLVGRRVPDVDLQTETGPTRPYELLHDARHVLLCLEGTPPAALAAWADRIRIVEASCAGPWELPLIGSVAAPEAVLIRPDGHVAWVGPLTDPGVRSALERWAGTP